MVPYIIYLFYHFSVAGPVGCLKFLFFIIKYAMNNIFVQE